MEHEPGAGDQGREGDPVVQIAVHHMAAGRFESAPRRRGPRQRGHGPPLATKGVDEVTPEEAGAAGDGSLADAGAARRVMNFHYSARGDRTAASGAA